MALIENSQPLPLHLPNLHLSATELYHKMSKEALKGAYFYQAAINPGTNIRGMSVEDLLGVASIHYRRRVEGDWSVGSVEYPVPQSV